jgi:UDP-N-acetylglucosamine 2-epimerase (non-hydrolysing)
MKLMLIVGARPQIIKSAPIIHEATKRSEIEFQLVHTGQHYDFEMSKIFFGELDLPAPIVNLGVGSGTHAFQTGKMLMELEKTIENLKPDMVVVPGDTNSTLAGALAAVKLNVPVSHVEAGARSYDMRMPEEVNRRLTDHCSTLLFAPTRNCVEKLREEGIKKQQIKLSGDTMYDALLQHIGRSEKTDMLKKMNLRSEEYAALTLHRPENVDTLERLEQIFKALTLLKNLQVVFPVHPRTKQRLESLKVMQQKATVEHIMMVEPLGYHEMLQLTKHAKMVITDSGGLQKEAFWLHTPCLTLRDTTEWIETIDLGANVLVGSDPKKIVKAAEKIITSKEVKTKLKKLRNPFGDGHASKKILDFILQRG